MEFKLSKVERAAADQNGWHAIAIYKNRHMRDTLPHGVIAFVRHSGPFEGRLCGTAEWAISDVGVFFHAGHYDLSRDDSMEDFTRRVERFVNDKVTV